MRTATEDGFTVVYKHQQFAKNMGELRLTRELAEWLAVTAKKSGVPQGKIIRDNLRKREHLRVERSCVWPEPWKGRGIFQSGRDSRSGERHCGYRLHRRFPEQD